MSVFPLSLGAVHSRATLKPQTSTTFTLAGGPGSSVKDQALMRYQVLCPEFSISLHWIGFFTVCHCAVLPCGLENNLCFYFFFNATSILQYSPTIWRTSEALSSKSSTFTHISYSPESSLSDARINRMLSLSVLRMFTLFLSRGSPFFVQVTTGLGLPWRERNQTNWF